MALKYDCLFFVEYFAMDLIMGEDTDGDRSYVFYGPIDASWTADDADVMFGAEHSDRNYHMRVGSAGDFDGDGTGDLLIQDYRANAYASNGGAAYVLFGVSGGF